MTALRADGAERLQISRKPDKQAKRRAAAERSRRTRERKALRRMAITVKFGADVIPVLLMSGYLSREQAMAGNRAAIRDGGVS